MRMMCYSVMTQAYSEKEVPSSPNRSRTYDLPITSSDALPLSYRRLVGAKAIKREWELRPLMPVSLLNNTSFSIYYLFKEDSIHVTWQPRAQRRKTITSSRSGADPEIRKRTLPPREFCEKKTRFVRLFPQVCGRL